MGNRVLNWQSGIARNRSECDPRYQHLWDGLVGAWYPKLGPTGATLRDVSGHHNHGVLTNMDPATAWGLGEDGAALAFDGLDDHITIPTWSGKLNPPWSVATYCARTEPNVSAQLTGAIGESGGGIFMQAYNNTKKWGFTQHNIGTWTFDYIQPLGEWHSIVVVGSGGTQLQLYVDSVFYEEITLGVTSFVGFDYLLCGYRNSLIGFNPAAVSYLCGYNHILSATEIRTLHETRGNCLLAKPDYGWLYGAQEEGLTALPGLASSSPSAFDPTALPGAISTLPGLAVSNPAAYQATGIPGVVVISPGYAESVAAAFDATGVPGVVAITPGLATSSPSAYGPTAAPGAVSALAGYAESIAAALDAQGIAGAVTVLPGLAGHASAAYQAGATIPGSGQTVYPGLASRVAAAFEAATVNAPTGLRHTLVLVDTRDVLLLVDTRTVLQIVDQRDTLRLV